MEPRPLGTPGMGGVGRELEGSTRVTLLGDKVKGNSKQPSQAHFESNISKF